MYSLGSTAIFGSALHEAAPFELKSSACVALLFDIPLETRAVSVISGIKTRFGTGIKTRFNVEYLHRASQLEFAVLGGRLFRAALSVSLHATTPLLLVLPRSGVQEGCGAALPLSSAPFGVHFGRLGDPTLPVRREVHPPHIAARILDLDTHFEPVVRYELVTQPLGPLQQADAVVEDVLQIE